MSVYVQSYPINPLIILSLTLFVIFVLLSIGFYMALSAPMKKQNEDDETSHT